MASFDFGKKSLIMAVPKNLDFEEAVEFLINEYEKTTGITPSDNDRLNIRRKYIESGENKCCSDDFNRASNCIKSVADEPF